MNRRSFLQMLGLFSGTTLLSSCGSDGQQKKLISYLVPPDEGVTPGEALWYVSTCSECPAGCGLQARVREGWPVKLEGNSGHPINDGALCVRGQSSLWRMYHPERFRRPLRRGNNGSWHEIGWEQAFDLIHESLQQARQDSRENLYLAGRTTGSLSSVIDEFCRELEIQRAPDFELFSHSALRKAYGLLFNREEVPHYRVSEADFLLTLSADLLETFVSPVDFARQQEARRNRDEPTALWVHLEPHYSLTGANADRRLTLKPGSEPHLLLYLANELAASGGFSKGLEAPLRQGLPPMPASRAAQKTGVSAAQLAEIRDRLVSARNPLLIAGGVAASRESGLETAVLAGLVQWLGGMVGGTVDFSRAENYRRVGSLADLNSLAADLEADRVGVLFVSRANPVYQAPAEMAFGERLKQASLSVALGDLPDETTRECDLVLPLSHALESWGDLEPRMGVVSLLKPVVKPLHESRTEGDILLALQRRAGGDTPPDYREYLFARWRRHFDDAQLEQFARRGYLETTTEAPELVPSSERLGDFLRHLKLPDESGERTLQIVPSLRRFDGRSRAIPLLEEVPDPLTTVSYGGWVAVSPDEARKLKVEDGERIRLSARTWGAEMPVRVQPGLEAGVMTVQRDLLADAPYSWDRRTGEALLSLPGVEVRRSGGRGELAILAGSTSQQGRGVIPDPVHRKEKQSRRFNLYPAHQHPDYDWGMVIDLRRCIGCSACVAACYLENNVPVVGKKEHLLGRELSWLRIEPFYNTGGDVEFVPMLCQHCHYAPCEPVCPVYAAYHNPEGLNVQIYNRCVGTRYCSNNCPYKVRRFNWWAYRREKPLDKMANPDLGPRGRGVMEKCTFCIQRIHLARDRAKDAGRPIRDGEVVPACAQTCPTGAIVFGNRKDPDSRVSKLIRSEPGYRIFEELGTEPSVRYLHTGGPLPEGAESHG